MTKKALVVVNLAGFLCFLRNDFQILLDRGYSIEVAADGRMADGSMAVELETLRHAGIVFHQIDLSTKNPFSKENLNAYVKLKEIIHEGDFDFITCHTPIVGLLTRLAAQRERKTKGLKVLYTTHGFSFCRGVSLKNWFVYFPIEYVMSAFCDGIVTINAEDYSNAKKMLCRKVFQLPGVGVDIERMRLKKFDRDAYRESIGVHDGQIMVLSVGELSARKNHEEIIKALALCQDKERFVYVICGRDVSGSGMQSKLQRLADELDVKIRLLGHRSDIPEINNCADIAALPSLREGLGLAGIEALAAGIPLVGSDVQGIRDYVHSGVDGFLCNPHSEREWSDAIDKLVWLNAEQKEQMKKNCLKESEKYSIKKSLDTLKSIYEVVLP